MSEWRARRRAREEHERELRAKAAKVPQEVRKFIELEWRRRNIYDLLFAVVFFGLLSLLGLNISMW